jgi:hypothetical protein
VRQWHEDKVLTDFEDISELASDYFRILHEGDVEGVRRLFLPQCYLNSPNGDGTMVHISRDEYIEFVETRESPKSQGFPVYGRILSIDQATATTAVLKVDCAVQPRYFLDYLSLVKLNGEWKIAAKVYAATRTDT